MSIWSLELEEHTAQVRQRSISAGTLEARQLWGVQLLIEVIMILGLQGNSWSAEVIPNKTSPIMWHEVYSTLEADDDLTQTSSQQHLNVKKRANHKSATWRSDSHLRPCSSSFGQVILWRHDPIDNLSIVHEVVLPIRSHISSHNGSVIHHRACAADKWRAVGRDAPSSHPESVLPSHRDSKASDKGYLVDEVPGIKPRANACERFFESARSFLGLPNCIGERQRRSWTVRTETFSMQVFFLFLPTIVITYSVYACVVHEV